MTAAVIIGVIAVSCENESIGSDDLCSFAVDAVGIAIVIVSVTAVKPQLVKHIGIISADVG